MLNENTLFLSVSIESFTILFQTKVWSTSLLKLVTNRYSTSNYPDYLQSLITDSCVRLKTAVTLWYRFYCVTDVSKQRKGDIIYRIISLSFTPILSHWDFVVYSSVVSNSKTLYIFSNFLVTSIPIITSSHLLQGRIHIHKSPASNPFSARRRLGVSPTPTQLYSILSLNLPTS